MPNLLAFTVAPRAGGRRALAPISVCPDQIPRSRRRLIAAENDRARSASWLKIGYFMDAIYRVF
jgi:hypothetical protein